MLVTFYHLNILWNLPWLFRFIEISPFPLSTRCFWNTKKLYFGSTSVLKSSFPLHRRPKILLVNLWQLMTASNASVRTQAWKVGGFKIPGFVCKLFLPFFPTPPPHSFTRIIFCTVFDSCSQFLAPKPNGNAFYAGSSLNHIFTQKFLKFSHRPPDVRQMQTVDWQVNRVNIVVECSNRFPMPKRDF